MILYVTNLGFTNANALGMFIKAGMSPDGRYIISGSEDGHVYSWEKAQLHVSFKAKRDKNNHFQYIKVRILEKTSYKTLCVFECQFYNIISVP